MPEFVIERSKAALLLTAISHEQPQCPLTDESRDEHTVVTSQKTTRQ